MRETEINLKELGNGWVVTITGYDTYSDLISPWYFLTLEEAFEYLQRHLGKAEGNVKEKE